MSKREYWWCIQSPQYGLLPFTAHTNRSGAIGRMCDRSLYIDRHQRNEAWKQLRREGFASVRVVVCVAPKRPARSKP